MRGLSEKTLRGHIRGRHVKEDEGVGDGEEDGESVETALNNSST